MYLGHGFEKNICINEAVDIKIYSGADALSILPGCLAENFAIIVDDSNRSGEKGTLKEIELILTEAGIRYVRGSYVR